MPSPLGLNDSRLDLLNTNTASANTGASALQREAELLRGGLSSGLQDRWQEATKNAGATLTEIGLSAGLGAALTYGLKAGGRYGQVAKVAGGLFLIGMVDDVSRRVIPTVGAIVDTWRSGENLEENRRIVAKNAGSALVDYPLMLASGLAGAGVVTWTARPSVRLERPAAGFQICLGENGRLGSTELTTTRTVVTEFALAIPDQVPTTARIAHPELTFISEARGVSEHRWRICGLESELSPLYIEAGHPNPLLARFELANGMGKLAKFKSSLTRYYAHAVPTEEALLFIKQLEPIVEAGAGNGYWSALLRARGTQVTAYDSWAGYSYKPEATWTQIITADASAVAKHADHTLFLSWPGGDAASKSLTNFKGKRLVYLGELHQGGSPWWHSDVMADDLFFSILQRDWKLKTKIETPQLEICVNDALYYFERKTRVEKLLERHREKIAR